MHSPITEKLAATRVEQRLDEAALPGALAKRDGPAATTAARSPTMSRPPGAPPPQADGLPAGAPGPMKHEHLESTLADVGAATGNHADR